MRIENDLKLGFKDVMIRPKRSTLKSRSQVTLEREFTFLHSDIRITRNEHCRVYKFGLSMIAHSRYIVLYLKCTITIIVHTLDSVCLIIQYI